MILVKTIPLFPVNFACGTFCFIYFKQKDICVVLCIAAHTTLRVTLDTEHHFLIPNK